jgi:WS/DGAT/MGAT family acyltransferase
VTPAAHGLSPLESAFVHVESRRAPMQIATIGIFEGSRLRDADGRIRLAELRHAVEWRLHRAPSLRRRLQSARLGEAPPVWIDDPHFDIANHVAEARIDEPGGERELMDCCARLLTVPLDRGHPLWKVWVLDGMADGRVAMLIQMHHAMVDGLAGVAVVVAVLFDVAPDAPPPEPPPPWRLQPAPAWPVAVLSDLGRLAVLPLQAGAAALDAAFHPINTWRKGVAVADSLGSVFNSRLLAPRSSLNVPIGPDRRYTVVRQPMEGLRRVAGQFGTTVNDVLLAGVAGGFSALLSARGEEVEGKELQVLVPVGLSHSPDRHTGNEVSALFVRVPLGVMGPAARLRRVADAVEHDKVHHQKLAAAALLGLLAPLPQSVFAGVGVLMDHQPVMNVIVTNVPGPPIPLYVLGDRLLEAYPVVPIAGNLSVGVAALSYEGQLSVGLLADPAACPDLDVLAEGMGRAFGELLTAAELAAAHGRRAVALAHAASSR